MKKPLLFLATLAAASLAFANGPCETCTTGCDSGGSCKPTYSHGQCTGTKIKVMYPHDECRKTLNPFSACWSYTSSTCFKEYTGDCACTPITLVNTHDNGYC